MRSGWEWLIQRLESLYSIAGMFHDVATLNTVGESDGSVKHP